MPLMSHEELSSLQRFVRERYASSGKPESVVDTLNEHNERVLEHVEEIAAGERLGDDDTMLLRTIAVLHDVTKADCDLLHHHETGSRIAEERLTELGKDKAFIEAVQQGILCHMGPFPFIAEEAEKHAKRTGEHLHFPKPQTRIDRLFYDADMLALMDVAGIEKVVTLRATTPQFAEEDAETAARDGTTARQAAYASAMRSVQRAADTLHSGTARTIAARLFVEAQEHVSKQLVASSR